MSKFHKKIIESSAFGFLDVYVSFIFTLIYTFYIAHLLSPELWGQLILALSFINFATLLCNFYPPAVEATLQYYIPKLSNTDEKKSHLRKYIFHVYKLKLISSIIAFIGYILIFSFSNLDPTLLLIIFTLSPLILFGVLNNINVSILIGFQKFKSTFIISLVNSVAMTVILTIIFIFPLGNVVFLVSLTHVLSGLAPFIVASIMAIPLIPKRNMTLTSTESEEFLFKSQTKYGLNLVIAGLIVQVATLFMNFTFLNFGLVEYITYLSICNGVVNIILKFSGSDRSKFLSIFSDVHDKEDTSRFERIFYQMFKLLAILLGLIAAAIFFFTDVYVLLIYSEIYLGILTAILIFTFTAFSRIILRNLMLIANSTNHTMINLKYNLFEMTLRIVFTYIALIFFDFFFLILFYVIISYVSIFFSIFLVNKNTDFKIKLKNLFLPIGLFIGAITITYLSTFFIYFRIFNISLIDMLFTDAFRFLIFVIIIYITIYFTKILTRDEVDQLAKITPILNSNNRFIQKIMDLFKHVFPKS